MSPNGTSLVSDTIFGAKSPSVLCPALLWCRHGSFFWRGSWLCCGSDADLVEGHAVRSGDREGNDLGDVLGGDRDLL
jgi:hypothetical protein